MSEIVNQLPVLIGVIVGAVMSYVGSALTERSRWRRSITTRWDEKRLDAYANYADSVKQEIRLSMRMAADLQLGPRARPLPLEVGLPLLAEAEDRRSTNFEKVLLLGDKETINAARQWQRSVWELQFTLQDDPDERRQKFLEGYSKADAARARFHELARLDLGVMGGMPVSTTWNWPDVPRDF